MSAIRERIRKLLALARDAGATSAEAEVALTKARQLMLDHGITDEPTESHSSPVRCGEIRDGLDNKWAVWLGTAAAELYGVSMLLRPEGAYYFVGRADNIAAAEETLLYLIEQVESKYKVALGVLRDKNMSNKATRAELRRTFKESAAAVVCNRVKEIIAAQHTARNGRALVVMETAAQEAAGYVESVIKPRQSRMLSTFKSGIGTGAGLAAGRQIKLQGEVNS